MQTQTIVSVKELRTNLDKYIEDVNAGMVLTIVKRSKAVFKIVPLIHEEIWESVVDFAALQKGV